MSVVLDGNSLTIEKLKAIARDREKVEVVSLAPDRESGSDEQ